MEKVWKKGWVSLACLQNPIFKMRLVIYGSNTVTYLWSCDVMWLDASAHVSTQCPYMAVIPHSIVFNVGPSSYWSCDWCQVTMLVFSWVLIEMPIYGNKVCVCGSMYTCMLLVYCQVVYLLSEHSLHHPVTAAQLIRHGIGWNASNEWLL